MSIDDLQSTTRNRFLKAATKRVLSVASEYDDQVALIKWFDLFAPKPLRGRLAAVPNASMVPAFVGKKLNLSGRRKGFPDLILLHSRGGYHGLVVELKRELGGVVSVEQKDWIGWLTAEGYYACICRGLTHAMNTITNYLDLPT